MSSTGHEAMFHASASRGTKNPSKLGGGEAWGIWLLVTFFVCWLFSIQTAYAVVSPHIQQTAHLSMAEVGIVSAIYTWVFAVVQFFSGSILDRYGSRPTMWIAAILVTCGAWLYAFGYEFWILCLAQIVLALGCAFGFVGAGYIGGKWFKAAMYGLMFALVETSSSVASAVMQPLLQWSLKYLTWQELLMCFGGIGIVIVIAFIIFVRDPRLPANQEAAELAARKREGNFVVSVLRDLWNAFKNRNVILSCLMGGATFGVQMAFGVLWGARIMGAHGMTAEVATIGSGLCWLGLAIGSPLINIWSNKWGNRRWPSFIATVLCLASVLLLLYLPHMSTGVAIALLFAIGFFASAEMLAFTIAGEAVPGSLIGSSAAVVNAVMFIVGGLLTSIPASFLPNVANPTVGDFGKALWLMWAVLIVGAVAILFIKGKPKVQPKAKSISPSSNTSGASPASVGANTPVRIADPTTSSSTKGVPPLPGEKQS